MEQDAKPKKERKTWDKEEWREKAKQKDAEEREQAQKNDDAMRKGKKPRRAPAKDLPKATEMMKAREGDLELDKNLNKTMVVSNNTGRGPGQPGFYCEICSRNHKDSNSYLDHLNSRTHLRMLGQSTRIERSTVEQVRARIAQLREETREASQKREYDFEQRLKEIKDNEDKLRKERKEAKKAAQEAKRLEMIKDVDMQEAGVMEGMMGFTGFGTSKK